MRHIVRIQERAESGQLRQRRVEQLKLLGTEIGGVSLRPVKFPPGRAKFTARPSITGSVVTVTTIGTVVVANRNAWYTGLPLRQ
jgi:hypothetical protein